MSVIYDVENKSMGGLNSSHSCKEFFLARIINVRRSKHSLVHRLRIDYLVLSYY